MEKLIWGLRPQLRVFIIFWGLRPQEMYAYHSVESHTLALDGEVSMGPEAQLIVFVIFWGLGPQEMFNYITTWSLRPWDLDGKINMGPEAPTYSLYNILGP